MTQSVTNPGYDEHGRHPWDDFFIANDDGTFTCGPCIPDGIDPGDEEVEVWEVGGHGWLGPVVCHVCKLSIEVYLDGEEDRPMDQYPEREMTKELFEEELNRIKSSFPFKNMLEHSETLKKKADADLHKVLVVYHAFHTACSKDLIDNPLVIGGYIERALVEEYAIPSMVENARQNWGKR